MNKSILLMGALVASAALASSASQATELLSNGGFEGGVQTVEINGFMNTLVPVDWTANAAFVQFSGFNQVQGSTFHSGANSLKVGDDDNQPLATLSQSFNDVPGETYNVSYWAAYGGGVGGDPNAFLSVTVGADGGDVTDTLGQTYEQFSFSFVGTGHDTLQIAAQTNPSSWFVDDVSVTGSTAGGAPEPATWAMMLVGFSGLGFLGYRRTVRVRLAA